MVWKRTAPVRRVLVAALVLALGLTACTPPPAPTPSPTPIGPDATVTAAGFTVTLGDVTVIGPAGVAPDGTGVHLAATVTQVPEGMSGLTSASKPLELKFDGGVQPSAPVTVTWRITEEAAFSPDTLAFLTVDPTTGAWSGLPVTVDGDFAKVTLTHSGFFAFMWAVDTLTSILNRVKDLLALDHAAPDCLGKTVTTGGRVYSVSAKPDGVYACVDNVKGQPGVSLYGNSPFAWRITPTADATGQAPASTAETGLAGYAAMATYGSLQGNKFKTQTALVPGGKATVLLNKGVTATTAEANVDAGLALVALLIDGVDTATGKAAGLDGPAFAPGTVKLDAVKNQGPCLAAAVTAIDTAATDLGTQYGVVLGCIANFGGLLTASPANVFPVVVAVAESLAGPLATQVAKAWGQTPKAETIVITLTSETALTPEVLTQMCVSKFGADTVPTGSTAITHKAWGPSTVVTCGPSSPSRPTESAGVLVVDATGTLRWSRAFGQAPSESFAMAKPATDKTGNIFINYNPGRYDGIAIVRPTNTGMKVLAGGYMDLDPLNFYYAELHGPGSNGRYTIEVFNNNCIPDCAGGTITSQTYAWNGTTYTKTK